MTAYPIRAPGVSVPAPLPAFTRVLRFVSTVIDTFVEAQEMAREAHKRYPFAAW